MSTTYFRNIGWGFIGFTCILIVSVDGHRDKFVNASLSDPSYFNVSRAFAGFIGYNFFAILATINGAIAMIIRSDKRTLVFFICACSALVISIVQAFVPVSPLAFFGTK